MELLPLKTGSHEEMAKLCTKRERITIQYYICSCMHAPYNHTCPEGYNSVRKISFGKGHKNPGNRFQVLKNLKWLSVKHGNRGKEWEKERGRRNPGIGKARNL